MRRAPLLSCGAAALMLCACGTRRETGGDVRRPVERTASASASAPAAPLHGETPSPTTRPVDLGITPVHVGMTLEQAEEAMEAQGRLVAEDDVGRAVYEWSVPLAPGEAAPDGRYGIRPLLLNVRATVENGRITWVERDR